MSENQQTLVKPIYQKWWFWSIIIFVGLYSLDKSSSSYSSGNNLDSNYSNSSTTDKKSEFVACPHCDGTGKRRNIETDVYGTCSTCSGTGQVKQGADYKWVKRY